MLVVMQELGRRSSSSRTGRRRWASRRCGWPASTSERVAGTRGAGEIKLAVAFHEPHARYDLFDSRHHGAQRRRRVRADRQKSIVLAWRAGRPLDRARATGWRDRAVRLIARDAAGAEVTEYRTIDGQRAATLTFKGTPADASRRCACRRGHASNRSPTTRRCCCAPKPVGALDALNLATVDYTKDRQQFGTPIARFQALQHRMVEMLIHAEQARSITYLAAARYAATDADERRRRFPPRRRGSGRPRALSASRRCSCTAAWA